MGKENPKEIPYISGNGTFLYFKKTVKKLMFQEVIFRAPKNIQKKNQEMDLSSPKIPNTLNKTPLRETRYLNNLCYLLAAQASIFFVHQSFPNTVS